MINADAYARAVADGTWYSQTVRHLYLLGHEFLIHVRAYGNWGGDKLYVRAEAPVTQVYYEIAKFVALHPLSNFSLAIADRTEPDEDDSSVGLCRVVVFDLDRAEKSADREYLNGVAQEASKFMTFLRLNGFKDASLLHSGTGYHVYFKVRPYNLFDEMERIGEELRAIWEAFARIMQPTHISLDGAMHPKKVMRMAGSYNRKLGYPVMAKWLSYSTKVDAKMDGIVGGKTWKREF